MTNPLPPLPDPIGEIVGLRGTPDGTREFWGYFAEDASPRGEKLRIYTEDQIRDVHQAANERILELERDAAINLDCEPLAEEMAANSVAIPQSADQAVLMLKMAWMWLCVHAPERLKKD